jgi:hypothetical protein
MGTEIKTPENCENALRNRKQSRTVCDTSEKLQKPQKTRENINDEEFPSKSKKNLAEFKEEKKKPLEPQKNDKFKNETEKNKNFTIKLEFDPMSIVLFTMAICTRFFRISEPRNVV